MNLTVIIPAYEKVADVLLCLNSLRALQAMQERQVEAVDQLFDQAIDTLTRSIKRDDPLRLKNYRHETVPVNSVSYHVQDDCSPSVNFPVIIPREVASCTRNDVNLGFAANCNLGAMDAVERYRPEVLMFVNQDVYAVNEWSPGWDSAIVRAFEDETVGIVAPRLLFPTGEIQSVGGAFDQLAQPIHRALGWKNPRAFDAADDVAWATGAALAVRSDVYRLLNGFDEGYTRGYFEDVDFCLRARASGFRVRYAPDCTLIHRVGSTGGSPNFMRNAARFKAQWVDMGKVKPGALAPTARYW